LIIAKGVHGSKHFLVPSFPVLVTMYIHPLTT
jgi:hypothetical protein